MRKLMCLLVAVIILITGCSFNNSGYNKYSYDFLGTFDTVIEVVAYTKTQEQFNEFTKKVQTRFEELDKLFDIYHDYKGINNIKTINDNAGIKPVKVRQEIIDLLLIYKSMFDKANGKVNAAFGPVLKIWQQYRENGLNNPQSAKLPSADELQEANKNTDMQDVIIDKINNTVFLNKTGMSLDVGAVAKGYATELVADEMEKLGYTSFLISGGGNVRTVGKPLDNNRDKWGVGIQDPNKDTGEPIDIAYVSDMSVVTSGDYQRYYTVNGKRYHHLIDPDTLMPASFFRSVTIVTKDSGLADFLSTAVFLMPYDEGRKFVESLVGVDALWIFPDGQIKVTDNLKKDLKILGGASGKISR